MNIEDIIIYLNSHKEGRDIMILYSMKHELNEMTARNVDDEYQLKSLTMLQAGIEGIMLWKLNVLINEKNMKAKFLKNKR